MFGVAVAHAYFRCTAYLKEPTDINPVCTRKVSEGSGSTFTYDLDHCLVVLGDYQIRQVVFRPSVGVVSPWIEVDVVSVTENVRNACRVG